MALLIVALSLIGLVRTSSLYEVGDSNGWTTTMGLDYYKTWSSSKNFYVGDILLFQYNETLHNVMEVSSQDFELCNPKSPLTIYQSQNEAVYLNPTGHYYFICGVPGHCESGQKLDVLVVDPINESNSPKSMGIGEGQILVPQI
ncbi:PREDICTED: mavicyanin-like [Camelina sativa]|uniref:Mavicyanin-like n=1 Tax=Camelina sativa TaxID=90675 RepID=A0ABM0X5W8_CAMSA|nr:PREDICTED: mavicyanin-like [Camelina sativa]